MYAAARSGAATIAEKPWQGKNAELLGAECRSYQDLQQQESGYASIEVKNV